MQGQAVIRFRSLHNAEVVEYRVRGEEFRVLDIPPRLHTLHRERR